MRNVMWVFLWFMIYSVSEIGAQGISRSVVNNVGTSFISPSNVVDVNIGESITGIVCNGNEGISQGFLQPDYNKYFTFDTTVCIGNLFILPNGEEGSATGMYYDYFNTAGFDSVIITGLSINYCPLIINLKVFIQLFYRGNGKMTAVLFKNHLSADSLACDSITVELHEASFPYSLSFSENAMINALGEGRFTFRSVVSDKPYYIVLKHRHALETWSKYPVIFDSSIYSFDFTNQ